MRLRNAVGMMLVVTVVAGVVGCGGPEEPSSSAPSEADGDVLFYRSKMDASFISAKPGKDAMGMDLVPVRRGDPEANLDVIALDGAVIQRMGVRLAPVVRGVPSRTIRALGRVELDETRITKVNMKFDGWIERIWVNETGQLVEKGSPLFAVYSQELVASQEEYIQALEGRSTGPHAAHLVRSARRRLIQFGVPESFVDRIAKSREAERVVVIPAPETGYAIHKTAFAGTFVARGANLYTLADLDALWVLAEVYEFDAPWVAIGQDATVELDYLPGQSHQAKVDYVYPVLDEKTRTLTIRLLLPNPQVVLKPGMFATVRLHVEPTVETLVVSAEAVIHSGERNVVFVSVGQGRFEPRELRLGVRGDDSYEVLDGLEEGEDVVVSGQFLLDSETSLKEAVKKMLGADAATASSAEPQPNGAGHAGEDH